MQENFKQRRGSPSTTSVSLLERAKVQDPQAWETLVYVYSPLVYRWCREVWKLQAHDTDNVSQEVFAAVFRKVGEFHHQRKGSFRRWLKTIAYNKFVDYRRAQDREPDADGGSNDKMNYVAEQPDEEDEATVNAEVEILYRRVVELVQRTLSDRHWQIFRLVVIEDQGAAEVAELMDVKPHVVHTVKSRTLKYLRDEFADLIDDERF